MTRPLSLPGLTQGENGTETPRSIKQLRPNKSGSGQRDKRRGWKEGSMRHFNKREKRNADMTDLTTGGAISRAINAAERAEEKIQDAPREFQAGALSALSQAWSDIAEAIHLTTPQIEAATYPDDAGWQTQKVDPDSTAVINKLPAWQEFSTDHTHVIPQSTDVDIWRVALERALEMWAPHGSMTVPFQDVNEMSHMKSKMIINADAERGNFVIRLV